jgi:CheY-like chemotaxis protein
VLVGAVAFADRVRIAVVDNGIGIPANKWTEVFKPFVQLHNPGHDREKGIGLGLSIVNAIVAVLPDHHLGMRSAEGVGTRFSLALPRYHGQVAPSATWNSVPQRHMELSSLFVWYVEDDEIARTATRALLDALGVLTEQAASFEALQTGLAFTERRPDLVITDYRLPGGHTACDVIALFTRRWDADIPVMILTGEAVQQPAADFGKHVGLLKKPTSPDDFISTIERLCVSLPREPAEGE